MPGARVSIRLVRHATLVVTYGDSRLLVDPMLAPAGSTPPIENAPNERRNPLVELPDLDIDAVDAVLLTHLHRDHLDDAAVERLPADLPVLCQPADEPALSERGFEDVRPVADRRRWNDLAVIRTPGRHGRGDLADRMGPVAGYVLQAGSGPTLYLAGDTVWYDGVRRTLEAHDPDAIVLNAGGAQFRTGDPITMTHEDVAAVCEHTTDPMVIAIHMEAINHCLETRSALADALAGSACGDRLEIPADGEWISVT
ncbi:MAG: MBL fold metallo-hydrolase [Halodesulfurarchaeum sp.]